LETAGTGRLSGRQIEELLEMLTRMYTNETGWEMLLRTKLDKSFNMITGDGPLPQRIFELMDIAMRDGWLTELLGVLAKVRPWDREFIAWIESNGWAASSTITPDDLAPKQAFELIKSMHFDLDELRRMVVAALDSADGPILGFVTRYSEEIFVAKLCDWLEWHVSNVKRKDALNLWPELGPVSDQLRAVARYRRDLDSADVLCTVHTRGVSADRVAEFWYGIHRDLAGISRRLILMFEGDATVTFPSDVIELPFPQFQRTDIHIWTRFLVHVLSWPAEYADAWTGLLCDDLMHDGVIDVRGLYEAMDQSINDARDQRANFRKRLAEIIGHANAP
jgi:hypothetical protein